MDCGDARVRLLLDRSLVYTGASRGANNIRVYTDEKAIPVGENSPVTRLTPF
jgi:ATP-dependent exoDNAse (exonuclease V) alpha subunit